MSPLKVPQYHFARESKMTSLTCRLALSCLVILALSSLSQGTTKKKPNVLLFLTDDLGFGDTSCYGNRKITTPNVDKLAKQGVRFTRMYSQNFCTPSRAALFTGKLPSRNGMIKGTFDLPVLVSPAQNAGLGDVEEEPNIASVLQKSNYHTQLIGKWHLGFGQDGRHGPMTKGFDGFYGHLLTHQEGCSEFYGIDDAEYFNFFFYKRRWKIAAMAAVILLLRCTFFGNKGLAVMLTLVALLVIYMRMYMFLILANPKTCVLVKENQVIEQPYNEDNFTLRITNLAVRFLKEMKEKKKDPNNDKPFFLNVGFVTPHIPPIVSKYHNGKSGYGRFYDSVLELDWSVGKIMEKLKEYGFDDNTLVIFTSDHGPTPHASFTNAWLDEGMIGSAGSFKSTDGVDAPLRGWKGSNFEGAIRVPGIVRWLGTVPQDVETNAITSHMDFLPTVLEMVGQEHIIDSHVIDGKSLLHLLHAPNSFPTHHRFLFHYCDMDNIGAVTFLDYKIHFFEGVHNYTCRGVSYDKPRLYNIANDPSESQPLPLEQYEHILKPIEYAVKKQHNSMTGSLSYSQLMALPIPWHYPCENFPYCTRELPNDEKFLDDFSELGLDA